MMSWLKSLDDQVRLADGCEASQDGFRPRERRTSRAERLSPRPVVGRTFSQGQSENWAIYAASRMSQLQTVQCGESAK